MHTIYFLKKRLFRTHAGLVVVLLWLMSAAHVNAQVFDNSRKVDTLSLAERISVRTNIVDWVATVPNIGFEFDLRKENWNRYAVNLNLRYRPSTSGTYVRPFIFDLFEVTLEGRQYWHERKAEPSGYLKRHYHWWDKIMSCRTMVPKHPRWIFYRGVYLSYADYSVLLKTKGRQGSAIMAGITWGFVKPWVAFQNGTSIDMEFGVSGGLAYGKYDTYTYNDHTNCYPKTGDSGGWGLVKYPVIRDVHAAIVYRFGNYPIQKKYRWRYDVDMAYHGKRDSIYNAWLAEREQKYIRDSLYKVVAMDFKQLYDSCVDERHRQEQLEIDAKAPKRLTQDSIRLRKQFVRDSIAARKDSLAREKAIKAGKPLPENKYTAAEQRAKKARAAAQKAKERNKQRVNAARSGSSAKVAGRTGAAATNDDEQQDDVPVLSAKEQKKAEQKAKQERARANAERAKARLAAQKAARAAAKAESKKK